MLIFELLEKLTPFKPPWFSHVVWEPFGQLLPWLLRLYYDGNKWSTEACRIHMPWSQPTTKYPFLQAQQVLALQVIFTFMSSITNFLLQPLSQRIWLACSQMIKSITLRSGWLLASFPLLANRKPNPSIPRTSKRSTRTQQIIAPTHISTATMYSSNYFSTFVIDRVMVTNQVLKATTRNLRSSYW